MEKRAFVLSEDSVAYRGYLYRYNAAANHRWIEKDGFLIQTVKTLDEARRVVDALLGD